jgi:hypothetical protein
LKYSKVVSLRAVFWRSNLDFIGVVKRLLRRSAPRNDFFRGLLRHKTDRQLQVDGQFLFMEYLTFNNKPWISVTTILESFLIGPSTLSAFQISPCTRTCPVGFSTATAMPSFRSFPVRRYRSSFSALSIRHRQRMRRRAL